jgi:uncharacterized cupredoxin-like copper-binding protein
MKHGKVFSRSSLVLALTLTAILLVTACAPSESTGVQALPPKVESLYKVGTYLVNDSDFASKQAADWSSAETVRVEFGEYYFEPDNITFEAGKPYKVELVNVGDIKHEFTAENFFASVAWRKAESAESEIKVPFFTEIEVFAGKQVDLYFVPITPGTYELVCEIEGHYEAGMFGTVTVTGQAPTSPAPIYASIASGPWITDGTALVKAADWGSMETIVIELGEFFFKPDDIQLKVGQPYKIILDNHNGDVKHEATAGGFFNTVAFRKVQDSSGEFKTPAPLEIETFAGKETELFLIPTKAGTYELICEIEGHYEAGMFGMITVIDSKI